MKKKALLIEDDRPAGEAFTYMLEKVGFEVGHARKGEDALEAAESLKPDVILLDIKLAGEMDGYAVMEELKKHPVLAHVPVLIVTNLGLMQDVERGKKSGAVEYLVKSDWSIADIAEKAMIYASRTKEEKPA
ncbi:MAG TPA: response regulator [Candidatus Baltobacteraceae bacterium]|nr:response regulator [Candidatus Baltobacteraceae bacterium]